MSRPDVILVSLDTLRRDRWCGLGAESCDVTPALGRWSERGILFSSATTPSAFTLSSHMSVMTGLNPNVHRVLWKKDRLALSIPLLAELLRAAEYRTEGVYSNMWLDPAFGFGRGFDRYQAAEFDLTFATRVVDLSMGSLDRLTTGTRRPFFLFLHFLDPHSDFEEQTRSTLPYYSPEPYRRTIDVAADSRRFCTDAGECATEFLLALNRGDATLDASGRGQLGALYDAGVSFLDSELDRFFGELERRGLFDSSLIVVFSDHGEELGEHGLFLHNQIYQECVEIPLWIKPPGAIPGAGRRTTPVETMDILPTILEFAQAEPPPHLQGRSLLSAEPESDREAFHVDRFDRSKFGLRVGDWKLIHEFRSGQSQLFDLARDPDETSDLSAAEPGTRARLLERLTARLRQDRALARALGAGVTTGAGLSPEQQRQLRSLGYL